MDRYKKLWEKEDEFLVDGEEVDEATAKAREEKLAEIRMDFKVNLVRVGSDREGVLTAMKASGWRTPSPKADVVKDDDEDSLGSDEEWEYYTDSEDRGGGAGEVDAGGGGEDAELAEMDRADAEVAGINAEE